MNTTQKFQPDQLVTWSKVEGQSVTKRQVAFEQYQPGGRATIQFGHNAEGNPRRFDVAVSELSRPEPTNTPPMYHSDFIRPPEPPKPPSEAQLATRIAAARAALAEAHEDVRRCRDVTRSTGALVDRSRAEHSAATAAVNRLTAEEKVRERQFEAALRKGETPPAMEPGDDRAAIDRRVQASEAALAKFVGEDRTAQARLGEATAAIRTAAVSVITAMLEQNTARLRQMELQALEFRAGLLRVTEWAGASGTALRLSEAAANVLTVPIDIDRARFLGGAAVPPWERLLQRLLTDPQAELVQPVADTQSEAA